MKLEAIKHQGMTSVQVGQKLLSRSSVAADAKTSETQIQRYIRLTYLIPELLSMVDENKIAFNPAVEISYLDKSEQRVLLDAMELNEDLKKYFPAGYTDEQMRRDIIKGLELLKRQRERNRDAR